MAFAINFNTPTKNYFRCFLFVCLFVCFKPFFKCSLCHGTVFGRVCLLGRKKGGGSNGCCKNTYLTPPCHTISKIVCSYFLSFYGLCKALLGCPIRNASKEIFLKSHLPQSAEQALTKMLKICIFFIL